MLRVRQPSSGALAIFTKAMYINIAGVWRQATPWVNISGVWKQCTPWVNISGVWK